MLPLVGGSLEKRRNDARVEDTGERTAEGADDGNARQQVVQHADEENNAEQRPPPTP